MMPEAENAFEGFELLTQNEEGVPIHGMQLITYLDEDGHTFLKWRTANEPNVEDMVLMLTRAVFIIQAREYVDHHRREEDGEDEDA